MVCEDFYEICEGLGLGIWIWIKLEVEGLGVDWLRMECEGLGDWRLGVGEAGDLGSEGLGNQVGVIWRFIIVAYLSLNMEFERNFDN